MLTKKKIHEKKKNFKKTLNKPFQKAICLKVFTKNPKKPNSANRKVCKIKLSTGYVVTASIPGISHNLNQRSVVLVKPAKLRDLPGVKFKIIRNKFDCGPVVSRLTSRSKYGKKIVK